MTQITKKFIEDNAVDEVKIRLSNDSFLRARNAANSADVSILKVDSANLIQFFSVPEVSADPTSANGIVRKSYVDNLLNGLKWKDPVRAATTANITLSGAQTIDGISVIAGDRVLVKDQSTASQNGIYIANASTWTRSLDADTGSELVSAAVFVGEGTANAAKGFVCATYYPVTLGVTSFNFIQFTTAGSFSAGTGITISGNVISVRFGTGAGEINSQLIPANYTSVNYTPVQVGTEGTDKISAHLKGIDSALAAAFTNIIANNQTSAADITNALFSPLVYRGVEIDFSINRGTGSVNACSTGTIYLSYLAIEETWSISYDSTYSNAGVTFDITDLGQLNYTSTNQSGTGYYGDIKYTVKTFLL